MTIKTPKRPRPTLLISNPSTSYVGNLNKLVSVVWDWYEQDRIILNDAEGVFEHLQKHIGNAWEDPQTLAGLVSPHGWAIFQALKIKYAEEVRNNNSVAQTDS